MSDLSTKIKPLHNAASAAYPPCVGAHPKPPAFLVYHMSLLNVPKALGWLKATSKTSISKVLQNNAESQ